MKMRYWILALTLATVWLLPAAASADEMADLRLEMRQLRADYESRIAQLQSQVEKLSLAQAVPAPSTEKFDKKADAGMLGAEYVGRYQGPFKKGGLIFREESGFGQVSVGGYMDHEFADFENTRSTFDQHRWIINVGAELGDRLRFYSEFEIEHGGVNASGTGEEKVEQAWVDYTIMDEFNLRGGALLVPFGRYNLYHDSDLQDLTARPIAARDVVPTTWTESGAGFWGEFDPALNVENLKIGYEAYVINGLNDGFTDTGLSGAKGSIETDNNNNKAWVGRVVVSPALGHEVGFSGYHGKYNNLDDDITGAGIDFLTTWGPFEFLGEYANFDVDEPAGANVANTFEGYYLQANYHFWPAILNDTFLKTGFDDPTFTLVGRYDWAGINDDSDATLGDNEEERLTLGLNYRPVESWVLKFEYQWNETENETLERGNNNGFFSSVAMGF